MIRKVPIVSALVVLIAAAIMIALGVWQLGRADEKAALLASYANADGEPGLVVFPADEKSAEPLLYRRSSLECASVRKMEQVAGTSAAGARGWTHRATCATKRGGTALVDLGWSAIPIPANWASGAVSGIVAPGPRLVADPALAGLEPLAKPDPRDLPNNHLSYAVQWFLFALTALVIYALALRRRWRERS